MQTRRIGVCGSDIHVYHGLHPYTSYPVVQGHEIGGVVADVGADVTSVKVGDKITFHAASDLRRVLSLHARDAPHLRVAQGDGLPDRRRGAGIFRPARRKRRSSCPTACRWIAAAMIEPIAVVVHALARGGGAEGKRVIVLGAGPIGNLTAQVAQASGAKAVMITDISPYKLDKARECGIDLAINTGEENLGDAIAEHFGPDKADLILECVGVEPTMTDAIQYARKGSTIVVVGVFGKKPQVDLGLVQDRELSLTGTLMYQQADYERAIELVASGKLKLDEMITHRFPFEQLPRRLSRHRGLARRIPESDDRTRVASEP